MTAACDGQPSRAGGCRPTLCLSGTSFNFGNNLVNNALTQSVVTVTNTGTTALTMNPTISGDPSYALVSTGSCGAQLAAAASCAVMVSYTPNDRLRPCSANCLLNLGFVGVPAGTSQTVSLSGTSAALPAGQVSATNNPQVALYTMTLPFPGSMTVSFGKDTTYGTSTWSQSTSVGGGAGKHICSRHAGLNHLPHAGLGAVYQWHQCERQ